MRALQVRIERISQERFRELHLSDKSEDRIYNCQIIWYTRRDPETGKVAPHANWVRMIRPTADPIWDTGWKKIVRCKYSNEDLLAVVEQNCRMVK